MNNYYFEYYWLQNQAGVSVEAHGVGALDKCVLAKLAERSPELFGAQFSAEQPKSMQFPSSQAAKRVLADSRKTGLQQEAHTGSSHTKTAIPRAAIYWLQCDGGLNAQAPGHGETGGPANGNKRGKWHQDKS